VRARCDDHVKPKPSSFLDVEHVSPVLDVLNGLASAHGVDAHMCARSVGLDNPPYAKILSHVRFLFQSIEWARQMAEGAFIWCGAETNCEVLSSMLSGGGRLPQSAR